MALNSFCCWCCGSVFPPPLESKKIPALSRGVACVYVCMCIPVKRLCFYEAVSTTTRGRKSLSLSVRGSRRFMLVQISVNSWCSFIIARVVCARAPASPFLRRIIFMPPLAMMCTCIYIYIYVCVYMRIHKRASTG